MKPIQVLHFRIHPPVFLQTAGAIMICMNVLLAEDAMPNSLDHFLEDFQAYHASIHHRAQKPRPDNKRCLAALPQMKVALKDDDAKLKVRVAQVLDWMYPLSESMAEVLIESLKDDAIPVRVQAAMALGRFLPDAEVVVRALQVALTDASAEVREAAALSLGAMGPNAVDAVEALEKQYTADPQARSRAAALQALVRIQPERANARVLEALGAQSVEVLSTAAEMPARLRTDLYDAKKVAAALSNIVADTQSDLRVRTVAFQTLSAFKDQPEAWAAVAPALAVLEGIKDGDDDFEKSIVYDALYALNKWPLTSERVTELIRPHIEKEHRFRDSLLIAILEKGKPDLPMAGQLVAIATSTIDKRERLFALRALVKSPFDRDKLAKLLLTYIEKGEQNLVPLLGECEAAAEPHLPLMLAAFEKADRYDGPGIAASIAKTGPTGVKMLVDTVLRDTPKKQRLEAASGLIAGQPPPAESVALLFKLAIGQDELPATLRQTLAAWGAATGPICAKALKSREAGEAYAAANIFKLMGDKAAPWVDDLFQAYLVDRIFEGTHPDAAQDALRAIGGPAIKKAIGIIEKGTSMRQQGARHKLAEALLTGMTGPHLAPFAAELAQLAEKFPNESALRVALALAYGWAPDSRAKLLALLRDPVEDVRSMASAVCYLQQWSGDDVVDALIVAAKLRTQRALHEFERLGRGAKKALPILLEIAQGNDRHYAALAIRAITSIGPGPEGMRILRAQLKLGDMEAINAIAWNALSLPKEDLAALTNDLCDALRFVFTAKNPNPTLVEQLTFVCLYGGSAWPPEQIKALMKSNDRPEAVKAANSAREKYTILIARRAPNTLPWISARIAQSLQNGGDRLDISLVNELAALNDPRALPVLRLVAAWANDAAVRDHVKQILTNKAQK
jgi:hypothetical protein